VYAFERLFRAGDYPPSFREPGNPLSDLHAIRVLDLTRVVSGPWCTQVLADLGAEVIKIERPGQGDDTRRIGPPLVGADGQPTGEAAYYLACNRNKRSITVDIASDQGAGLVRELAAVCDVVVENYKVGNLQRFGLDSASLRAINPRLIYCSINGFGPDGPYAPLPAYDFVLQGLTGIMSTCGRGDDMPGGEPMRTAVPLTDQVTGLYAAVAILGALLQRGITGEGRHIDMAMIDCAAAIASPLSIGWAITGRQAPRVGNDNPIAAPSGVFPAADGRLIIASGNDAQFAGVCRALGLSALRADPRAATNPLRVANRELVHGAVAEVTRTRSMADLMAALQAEGVPCGPINDFPAFFADPQAVHRGALRQVPHPAGVPVPLVRSPLDQAAAPAPLQAPPRLGEHTEAVLGALLGLSAERLSQLRAAQVI
jgi:crotonobetainyl-CoA:carnitine CoA-transferase CaiB-like acyl-CoA transferase